MLFRSCLVALTPVVVDTTPPHPRDDDGVRGLPDAWDGARGGGGHQGAAEGQSAADGEAAAAAGASSSKEAAAGQRGTQEGARNCNGRSFGSDDGLFYSKGVWMSYVVVDDAHLFTAVESQVITSMVVNECGVTMLFAAVKLRD